MGVADTLWLVEAVTRELSLFAGVGLLLGGLDDLAIDLIWLVRQSWRRLTRYRGGRRVTVATLRAPARPGRIAVVIGAWHEAGVIGAMLETACRRWGDADFRIYVGLYPNDPETVAEVRAAAARDPRVRPVPGVIPGPTTKAEALNRCWTMLQADEAAAGETVKAVLLHDAEDMVHPHEIRVFDSLIETLDLVQLPVLPLIDQDSRWVAGHYADEFAEAHGKQLVVREALGAGVPMAGTGCAIARHAIAAVAERNGGFPFTSDSLTEDYELGLRLKSFGGRCAFVRIAEDAGGPPVAVRAYFPATFDAAVRQKCRWLRGIAFEGWDRLGWDGGIAERWMRLRDRRAPLAALVLTVAYLIPPLVLMALALRLELGLPLGPLYPVSALERATAALLAWRLVMRVIVVTRLYGWREGLRAVPRLFVGNVIAMAAAGRALLHYAWPKRAPAIRWDKTTHAFPHRIAAE
ncbi:MAG: glycosyl transferase family protein [Sphingomonas sp.]